MSNSTNLEFPEILRGKTIILATESFGPVNGVSKTTLNLVQYLRNNGIKVAVVAPEINTAAKSLITSTNDNEIEVRLKGYPLPYDPSLSVVYPFRLSQIYKRAQCSKPDLIYLASPASLGFQILLQLRSRNDAPPVLLNFQTDLSGYCSILFPPLLDAWAVWVFTSVQGYLFSHENVKTVFYPSLFSRKFLEGAGVQSEKLRCLRRGVDCTLFSPERRNNDMRKEVAPNGELLLVCVGRLAPEKGFDFLSQVVRRLGEMGCEFKLVVVGGNQSPRVEEEIQSHFRGSIEKGIVIFRGLLRGEALAQEYASADIFLHCSITETFGLVVLEAMASGIPVIARDEGGPSEIVADSKSGYLVPPTDLESFVHRVVKLGADEPARRRMGAEARRMAEIATWDRIGNQVAWEMAEALENQTSAPKLSATNHKKMISRTQDMKSYLAELGAVGVTSGIWCGLIATWVAVRISLILRGTAAWMMRFLRISSNAR
ncbi:glycosyltransferase family 4 protein [Halenospora varia]|nr:glycosyltransferase family 4 protein [Halenospora varia]